MGLELMSGRPGAGDTLPWGTTVQEWGRKVHEIATSAKEVARRAMAAERVKLYRDDYKQLMCATLRGIFTEWAVYQRLERMVPMLGGTSFVKRVADELGRPLYATAPVRRVVIPGKKGPDVEAQAAYAALAAEMGLDAQMDTTARLLTVNNDVHQFPRFVKSLGRMQLDVMTPDMLTVIPHPDVPTVPLAVAYVKRWQSEKPFEWVVWDDKRYFTIGPRGGVSGIEKHDLGILPFLDVHQRGRTCDYWQETRGEDLIAQTKQSMFIDAIALKKIHSQSHRQLTYVGDSDAWVKGQVADEQSVIHAEQGQIGSIDLESDPSKYTVVKADNESAVAANHGISRDRMNQKASGPADDVALHERVAELAAIMAPAESRLFEIVKVVSREHPKYRGKIPDDAVLLVDLGQIHNRVDRKTQLDIREKERSMGLRSGVDDVLEDNPEFGGDREQARNRILEAMGEEALIVRERRALNMPEDGGSPEAPGQSPEANGALGPMVRDGKMTRDQAASASQSGADGELEAMARRILAAVA